MPTQKPGNTSFLRLVPRFSVNNLGLALDFYRKLEFSTTYNDGSLVILSRDGVDLHMHYSPDDPPSHSVWWIEVKNIEELYQKCMDAVPNYVCSQKVQARPWGFKEFLINDPFRNLILFDEKI